MIAEMLEKNAEFVRRREYEPLRTDRFPNKKMVVLTCMDTRLTELVPRAMSFGNGDVKLIKNAGAIVSHPFGSVMRSVLVDHARARAAVKRGSGLAALELKEDVWIDGVDLDAVSDLDEALKKLEMLDPRQSQIVEQRYFGGLSLEETASALALSLATVKRELRTARAWLANELASQSAS